MKRSLRQEGFGLIEVLVAVLVLSVSLLAIASLQTRSLQFNQSAYWRTQANILAYDIFDRLRSVRQTPGLHQGQIAEWQANIAEIIPGGEGNVACDDGTPPLVVCTVTLQWTEGNIFGDVDEDDLDLEARTTLTYVSII